MYPFERRQPQVPLAEWHHRKRTCSGKGKMIRRIELAAGQEEALSNKRMVLAERGGFEPPVHVLARTTV